MESVGRFRRLIYDTKEFREYFEKTTPIRELTLLKIGFRPVSRAGTISIEDVRAIPWVFSWTQNRHLVPGWYPAGSVLNSFISKRRGGLAILREMYEKWFFFKTVIDNLQMIMIKADMMIAELYSGRRRRCCRSEENIRRNQIRIRAFSTSYTGYY